MSKTSDSSGYQPGLSVGISSYASGGSELLGRQSPIFSSASSTSSLAGLVFDAGSASSSGGAE